MADIFDEIQEDLRAERAQALLKRYGVLLVALVVLVVLGVAGWQAWQWRARQSANDVAGSFMDAMRDSAPTPSGAVAPAARAQAEAAFQRLATTAPDGYRTLARLREAALRAGGGDGPGALTLWDQVAADPRADPLLRGLADLLWVQHQVDQGDPAAVEARLAPLTAPGNAWRGLAQESQAMLAIRTGRTPKARDILKALAADPGVPEGVRVRATGLLTRLGEPAAAGAGG